MRKLLVACEESQRVCEAFRNICWEAYSCDITDPSGTHPEWHIKQDVLPLLNGNCAFTTMDGTAHIIEGKWDMIIGFPPCTYLTNAGAMRLFRKPEDEEEEWRLVNVERLKLGIEARDFFTSILNADCEKIAIENPVPLKIFNLPQYHQIIHPYYFGDPYKKRTCLWLKGLAQLIPTNEVKPLLSWVDGGSKTVEGKPRANRGRGFRDSKTRATTFPGIANAMAEQWGK